MVQDGGLVQYFTGLFNPPNLKLFNFLLIDRGNVGSIKERDMVFIQCANLVFIANFTTAMSQFMFHAGYGLTGNISETFTFG